MPLRREFSRSLLGGGIQSPGLNRPTARQKPGMKVLGGKPLLAVVFDQRRHESHVRRMGDMQVNRRVRIARLKGSLQHDGSFAAPGVEAGVGKNAAAVGSKVMPIRVAKLGFGFARARGLDQIVGAARLQRFGHGTAIDQAFELLQFAQGRRIGRGY